LKTLRLANFAREGSSRVGIVREDKLYDVSQLSDLGTFASVDEIVSKDKVDELKDIEDEVIASRKGIPLSSVKLINPILYPEKILLAAVNYRAHGKEQGSEPLREPYFFTKFRNALIGPGDEIVAPKISKQVDWEVELAVIIGRKGKYIEEGKALDYVAGYSIAVDVSFRDLRATPSASNQKSMEFGTNWLKAKGLDSSFPLGPWLVTKEEIPDPQNIRISLAVNGVTKQDSSTSDMIFPVKTLVAKASSGITLKPGDVISTGTPAGVAVFTGQPFLKDGDVLEAKIEGIGTMTNPVRAEICP
jgi:2-keto-4-pentenoate hydratase/2-oxohepta-3-ene-1,7-dioic acid hydratase in catechol pathway